MNKPIIVPDTFTDKCVVCKCELNEQNICCDTGTHIGATKNLYQDGICVDCHKNEHNHFTPKDGVGGYEVNVD